MDTLKRTVPFYSILGLPRTLYGNVCTVAGFLTSSAGVVYYLVGLHSLGIIFAAGGLPVAIWLRRRMEDRHVRRIDERRRERFRAAVEQYGSDTDRQRMAEGFLDPEQEGNDILARVFMKQLLDIGFEFVPDGWRVFPRQADNTELPADEFEKVQKIKSCLPDASIDYVTQYGGPDAAGALHVSLHREGLILRAWIAL